MLICYLPYPCSMFFEERKKENRFQSRKKIPFLLINQEHFKMIIYSGANNNNNLLFVLLL